MGNGKSKLNEKGCEFGRANRIQIEEIKTVGWWIIRLLVTSIISPVVVGIFLWIILRKP